MEYSHFIITQFNLRNFPKSNNSDYESWLEWTRKRTELFKEYCLPSVINQSCKSFKWLLYFDADTPDELTEFLDILRSYSFIDICICKGIGDFNSNYTAEIKRRSGESVKWIITTRIDNDDCLHRDAVKIIQENLVEKDGFLISLASGYLLNIYDRTLSHYFYPMSPFITLVEANNDNIKGIFGKGHTKYDNLRLFISKEIWIEYFNGKARMSRFILKKPLWIQTVHGENVSNNFYRGFPVIKIKDLKDFSVNYKNNSLSIKTIRKYANYVIWKRYLKCLIIKVILKK
jgi:Putative rhamnosyl transferase